VRLFCAALAATILCVLPATASAQQVILDPFTGPDGIIASQSCFFGSGCTDPIWAGGDSGVLRRKANQGYVAGDQYFRSWTKRHDLRSIRMTANVKVTSIGSSQNWNGAKFFLRREVGDFDGDGRHTASANEKVGLYTAEFATRGRYIEIQRKNRGQDTYTILAFKGNTTPPLNVWQTWSASLVENAGGAGCADDQVALSLSINGVQQLAAVDKGCAAVMMSESEGAVVGLRSDNTVWYLDDFTVDAL
jgi:hypothetical protein